MRILLVHNRYLHRGGEDAVFDEEAAMLAAGGHEVRTHLRDNHDIAAMGAVRAGAASIWSPATYRSTKALIADWAPDVVHVHNSFPLVSPAIYWAASQAGVPVVKTLHNFRLACLQGTFLRDGQACEDCLGKLPLKGVLKRCYRGSATQSGVLAAGLVAHRLAGTYRSRINRFIALDASSVPKFVAAGIPAERIRIKPNCVTLPPVAPAPQRQGGLFVGRLSAEKGIHTLAAALMAARVPGFKVIGTGELLPLLAGTGATLLGQCSPAEVYAQMAQASYLVLPSIGFEQFPRVVAEAFGLGLPVIASRRGALANLVQDGQTGLLVEPGDAAGLAAKLRWAEAQPEALRAMGERCQQAYAATLSPAANLQRLLEIYREAGAG